jgi:hypothetical protein
MSFSFYDRVQSGRLISRANSDIRSVQMYLTFAPAILVQCAVAVVAVVAVVALRYMLSIPRPPARARPRRGDLQSRSRIRGEDRGGPRRAARGPHGGADSAQAHDGDEGGPHRRRRPRPHRRGGNPRRTRRTPRALRRGVPHVDRQHREPGGLNGQRWALLISKARGLRPYDLDRDASHAPVCRARRVSARQPILAPPLR